MAFDRYLGAAIPPAPAQVDPAVAEAAGRQAAGYQSQFAAAVDPPATPRIDATKVQAGAINQAKAAGVIPPKFVKGDFGFVYRDAKVNPSLYNKAQDLGSTIEFQDIGEGRTVSVISSNTALANVTNANNVDMDEGILAAVTDKRRKAVLMKMVLDGGLARNVKVSPEDAAEAGSLWVSPTNKDRQFEIEKAWALVKQNTGIGTVNSTIESDQFTLRTRQKFGMTPSEYLVNGYSSTVSGEPLNELGAEDAEDVADEVAKRTAQIKTLEDEFYKTGTDTNPHLAPIVNLKKDYDEYSALLLKLPGESPAFTKIKSKIANLNDRIQQEHASSTAWDAQQQQAKRRLDAGRQGLNDLLERVKGVGGASAMKASMENSRATGVSSNRWVGTGLKDVGQHFGYSAAAMDEIDPQIRYQYIVDNSVMRKAGESAADFNQRKKVKDRTDNPELMWYLARNAPSAFERISQSMPTQEEINQSKLTTETLVNNAYHFETLFNLNETLRTAGFVEGFTMKNFSADVKAAASARANLIGQMRVFIVGPGNPSNFEQEILHSIIPEIDATFSVAKFHKERLRALAMIAILAHHNEKTKLGLKMNDTSMELYNQRFAKLLGRKLTAEELDRFAEFSAREADAYGTMKNVGNIDVGDRQGGGYGTGRMTTAQFGKSYFDKVEANFGR
jgi:hypothetical protein